MSSRHNHAEHFELLPRTSHDSTSSDDSNWGHSGRPAKSRFLSWMIYPVLRLLVRPTRSVYVALYRHRNSRGLVLRSLLWLFTASLSLAAVLVVFTFILRPSYSHPPSHYQTLQSRCRDSKEPGRGNINNEKVYIAATLYDRGGSLVAGRWGEVVSELVDLLGPQNVHLSIYENDADESANAALQDMTRKAKCNSTLLSEHLALEELPQLMTPSGEKRTKRIAFLAEVRNRALRGLQSESATQFDKLLFINDVIFDPTDAVNLLFSTNIQQSGRTQYQAACAVDFINAFKFYDRFATRDFEGYTTGIPFFPWFTNAGQATSRQDVFGQKDAVRVRSCWGGMTAFEAKWFQHRLPDKSNNFGFEISPLRFRYEADPFWDASECCLIHADLTYLHQGNNITTDSGIFMNPYIRVAYDRSTVSWLPYTRRVERLYSVIHNILNYVVGMPEANPRRLENPGDEAVEKVWKYDEVSKSNSRPHGSYQETSRVAEPGRFCGTRKLMVLIENPQKGQKNWENLPLPPTA
ncbi:hypothetical protein MMC29_007657 [Sticta canariensis]|nr:hypothetical protein [Sticta canariensis]